jgi:hypothetical protein
MHSKNRVKLTNTLSGQNVELLNIKAGGTYSSHCALKCYNSVALVRQRTILTERPSLVGEVSAKFSG